jgi:hypothetical protein
MLVYKSVYLLITVLVFRAGLVNGSNQLHIGGIFPIGGKGGWQGGQGKRARRFMIAILNVDGKGRREVLAAVQNFLDLLLFVYLRPYTRFTFIGLDFQWPEEHSHV